MQDHTAVVPSILEQDGVTVLERIRRLPDRCTLVEIRADHLSPDDLSRVVAHSGRELVVTVRRVQDGGAFSGAESERWHLLQAGLAAGAAYVDLEIDSPAAAERLVPRERLVLSWHGEGPGLEPLPSILSRMTASGAALYKLVPKAAQVSDLTAIRDFLKSIPDGGPAVICFAAGRFGALSRILAPSWGSRWTIGFPPGGRETGEGQFPVSDLLETYDVKAIGDRTRIFGLLGSDLGESPSPAMHNAALRDLGIEARYLPMEIDRIRDLAFLSDSEGPIKAVGFGVTMPFKEEAAALCTDQDHGGLAAGAVNTLVAAAGGWQGHNTDATAIRRLVGSLLQPRNCRALVHGAGGTARTAATVLRDSGAVVSMLGRNPVRVRQVAGELGIEVAGDWNESGSADIFVNATPVGRDGEDWPHDRALPAKLVLDAAYGRSETDLVRKARESGLAVISGREMILAQAVDQFRMLTGRQARQEVMVHALESWFKRDPA